MYLRQPRTRRASLPALAWAGAQPAPLIIIIIYIYIEREICIFVGRCKEIGTISLSSCFPVEDPTFCIIRLLSSKRSPPSVLQGKRGSGLIIKGDDRSGSNWCLVCYVDSQYSTFIPYLSVSLRCVSTVYVAIFCSGIHS